MEFDIAVIGAGPSGLFTCFQAGMLGMKSCIIDNLSEIGGQCSALYPEKPIYDIPAYPEILAIDLIKNLDKQSSIFNPTKFLAQQVQSLKSLDNGSLFELVTSANNVIRAKVVIIAAGAGSFGPNRPPLENIKSYEGKSIFYSVTDKYKFSNKKIVIAGGGDSALDWAVSLSEIANIVIVHRRSKFRGAPATIDKLHKLALTGKIELVLNYQLSGLSGEDGLLQNVEVSDLNGNKKLIEADILLPFFGLSQDLGPILEFGLNIKNHHIISKPPYFETNIAGIYAIGDVATYEGKLKLILTSFSEAASAIHHAYERVFSGKALHFEYSTTKAPRDYNV